MQTYLRENNSEDLIVIMNGWGMDEKPFLPIKSDCDVLFLSDYTNSDFSFDFAKYKKKILISFSAGVMMAGYLQKNLPQFDLKIAINGILNTFDKHGIPGDILFEIENISMETALDFRKKLINEPKHIDLFNINQPSRSLESSQNELCALKNYVATNDFKYDKVILGENDEIIPVENQKKAWEGHKNTRVIKGGHFLFYSFDNFNEIIEL